MKKTVIQSVALLALALLAGWLVWLSREDADVSGQQVFSIGADGTEPALEEGRDPSRASGGRLVSKVAQEDEGEVRRPLQDIDERPRSKASEGNLSQDRAAALERLREAFPELSVDFDPVTGTAKWVASNSRFLTPPSADGLGTVKRFMDDHADALGHGSDALQSARQVTDYTTEQSGARKMVWHQQHEGIDVFEAVLQANVTGRGELINIGSQFVPRLAGSPKISTESIVPVTEAVALAGRNVGESVSADSVRAEGPASAEPDRRQQFRAALLTDADAKLTWLPMNVEDLRLAWDVTLTSRGRGEMYRVLVDAESGGVLVRQALTAYITDATYRVYTSDSPSPFSPGHPTPQSGQPPVLSRSLVTTGAFDTTASPDGWLPAGGTETVGNNVDAHLDLDADNVPDLPRPQTLNRVFDFPLDLAQGPETYRNASVTQLFYYCNWIHDRLYQLGFTEAAGNFQTNNFGRGGIGGDLVQAQSQDGSGTNNANFSTPPDGSAGRMQMFVWTSPTPDRDSSFDGEIVIHEYAHGLTNRLVGGPSVGISQLQSRGMGEGWSDFYALCLLSDPGDNLNASWPEGGYSTFQLSGMTTNYYFGIRRYPYSTDMSKAPLTYRDIDPTLAGLHTGVPLSPRHSVPNASPSQFHAQGEVWCNMLWEARAKIIETHGWAVGNELMLQLVTDGLKLAPANPTFIQARDAILQADLVNHAGANRDDLWAGFAKRGIGASAFGPANDTTTGVSEAFDVPDTLSVSPVTPFVAQSVVGGAPSPGSSVFTLTNGGTSPLNWTVSDDAGWLNLSSSGGTLAGGASTTVTATFSSAAFSLPAGVHEAAIQFTNAASGAVIQRTARLTVEPVLVPVYQQNFASAPLGPEWVFSGTGTSRTQVTAANGPRSGMHLTMDSTTTGSYARNEATLTLNLAGRQKLRLEFWAKEFNDEPNGPPSAPFTTGADFDGVAVSADGGVTWYEVHGLRDLTADWSRRVVDLDAALAARGLSYTANFKIRFNQYDNFSITTDGIAIDDVLVAEEQSLFLTVEMAAEMTEGAGDQPGNVFSSVLVPTDVTVTLVAENGQVSVPATVTIPAGQDAAFFHVTPVDDALLDGSQPERVRAFAAGYAEGSEELTVRDNETAELTLTLPASAAEGAVTTGGELQPSVAPDRDIRVELSSSLPGVSVPTSLTLPAGSTAPLPIPLTVAEDALATGNRTATVAATVPGWTGGSAAVQVVDNDAPVLTMSGPSAAREGDGAVTCALTVNTPLAAALTVALSSSDETEATVPATVEIPAGSLTVNFPVTVVDDADFDGTQTLNLSATAAGYPAGSLPLEVRDNDVHHLDLGAVGSPQRRNVAILVPVTARDVNGVAVEGFAGPLVWTASAGGSPVPFTAALEGSFSNGTGTYRVTMTDEAMGNTLRAEAPNGSFGLSNAFEVERVDLDHFDVVPAAGTRRVDTPFGLTVTARDDLGAVATDYAEPTVLETWQRVFEKSIFLTASDTTSVIYNCAFHDSRSQIIYTTEELGRAKWIGGLSFTSSASGTSMQNFKVRVKLTDRDDFDGATWDEAGWTTVDSFPSSAPSTSILFTFDRPFYYDGVRNLMVDISFDGTVTGTPGLLLAQDTGTARVLHGASNSAHGSPLTWSATTGPAPQVSTLVPRLSLYLAHRIGSVPGSPVAFTNGVWSGNVAVPTDDTLWFRAVSPSGVASFSDWLNPSADITPAPGTDVIFSDTFETGMLGSHWDTSQSTSGSRIQVSTANSPPQGSYHLLMDSSTPSGSLSRNEAELTLDLTGRQNVMVQFLGRDFSDENYSVSGVFGPGRNFDGVAVSTDGASWVLASDLFLSTSYIERTAAIDPALIRQGWLPGAQTRIKFVQYDDDAIPNDGIALDNIRVTANAPNAIHLNLPPSLPEGTVNYPVTVTLPSAAVANTVLTLTANASAWFTVPPTVTVPAGQTQAVFNVSTAENDFIDNGTPVFIAVSGGSYEAGTYYSLIEENDTGTITIDLPAQVPEGSGPVLGVVRFDPAPAFDTSFTLLVDGNQATVTILNGTTLVDGEGHAEFTFAVLDDLVWEGNHTVTVTASSNRYSDETFDVEILDNESATLALDLPDTVPEGIGTVNAVVALGVVTANPVTVALAVDRPDVVTAPAEVVVPAFADEVIVPLPVLNNDTDDGSKLVTLTATVAGLGSASDAMLVRDDDPTAFSISSIPSPVSRNQEIPVTVTALNSTGVPQTLFRDAVTVRALAGGVPVAVTPETITNFSEGIWTGVIAVGEAADGVTITVSHAGGAVGISNPFDVEVKPAVGLAVRDVPIPVISDNLMTAGIVAVDDAGARVSEVSGPGTVEIVPVIDTDATGAGGEALPAILGTGPKVRAQFWIPVGELPGAGTARFVDLPLTAPPGITGTFANARLRLQATTASTAPETWLESGWTEVWAGELVVDDAAGVRVRFQTPFVLDGTSGLLLDLSHDAPTTPPAVGMTGTGRGVTRGIHAFSTTVAPELWTGTEPAPMTLVQMPDVSFGIEAGSLETLAVVLAQGEGGVTWSVPAGVEEVLLRANLPSVPPLSGTGGPFPVEEPGPLGLVAGRTLFEDDFELPAFKPEWTITGTENHRTQVTTDYAPRRGSRHMFMDSTPSGPFSRNEATFAVDFSGLPNAWLTFWMKETGDEDHGPPPSPFVGGADFDGVAISENGQVWYEVIPLRTPAISASYQEFSIDLLAAATNLGLTPGPGFQVRFNHYDNFPTPSDGFGFDDVSVAVRPGVNLVLSVPAEMPEGDTAIGQVTIGFPMTTDLVVSLRADRPVRLEFPPTVTIPAGALTADFELTAREDSLLTGDQQVELGAEVASEFAAAASMLLIRDNEAPDSLAVALAGPVPEGGQGWVTVSLTPVLPYPVFVDVALTLNPGVLAPARVAIPAGAGSADFSLFKPENFTAFDPTNGEVAVTVGGVTESASFAAGDNDVPVLSLLVPATVVESSIPLPGTANIALPLVAARDTEVTLSSSLPGTLSVPASATIAAGSRTAFFDLTPVDNALADGSRDVTITVSAPGAADFSINITVVDDEVHHFDIDPVPAILTAGAPFNLTVRAMTVDGVQVSGFGGTAALSLTSATGSPLLSVASADPFVGGVWSESVTVSGLASGVQILAQGAGGVSGASNAFDTQAGPLAGFEWSAISSPQLVEDDIPVTLRAVDAFGNTVSDFSETVALSASKLGGSPAGAVRVLSLTTYSDMSAGGEYQNTKTAISGSFTNYTETSTNTQDAAVLAALLGDADVLLIHEQESLPAASTLPTTFGPVISAFVQGGGTVIACSHMQNEHLFLSEAGLLTLTKLGGYGSRPVTKLADTFLSEGVPASFTAPYTSEYTTGDGIVSFLAVGANPLVIHRDAGAGRAIMIGTDYHTLGSGMDRVIGNAVKSAQDLSVPVAMRPDQTAAFTAGVWSGSIEVLEESTGVVLKAAEAGGKTGSSNAFDVTFLGDLTLTLDSGTVSEGVASFGASVTIPASRATDTLVRLESGALTDVTPATATVTIPAGATSAPASFLVIDDADLDGPETVRLTVAAAGYRAGFADVVIEDDDTTTVTVSLPAVLAETAGTVNDGGTVTLGMAPLIDMQLTLASSDASELTVPASVTVLAGETAASFPVTAVDDAFIDGDQPVTVTATLAGSDPGTGVISIQDDESNLITLTVNPATVVEGDGVVAAAGLLQLAAPVEQAVTFEIATSDGTEVAATTVEVTAGNSSNGFDLTVIDDGDTDGSQIVTLSASAAGFASGTAEVTVRDDDIHHFLVSSVPASVVRNLAFPVSITAADVNGETITGYAGSPALTASTAGGPIPVQPASVTGFVNGVATVDAVIDAFATGVSLAVTDSVSGASGGSNAFDVAAGAPSEFRFATIPSPQEPGVAFPVTISAFDEAGNAVTDFDGTADLSLEAAADSVSIGTGGSASSAPFNTFWPKFRSQQIQLASEIGQSGRITSLAMTVLSVPGTVTLTDFTIRLKHTSLGAFATSGNVWETADFVTVFQGDVTISETGEIVFPFATPFLYDETSNLMVDYSYRDRTGSSGTTFVTATNRGTSARPTVSFSTSSTTFGDPLSWSGITPLLSSSPTSSDIRLGFSSDATLSPATTPAFVDGVWSGTVTVQDEAPGVKLRATSGIVTGVSNTFDVWNPVSLSIDVASEIREGSGSHEGTVRFSRPNSLTQVVTLSSSNPGQIEVPAVPVVIPAGALSASFSLNVIQNLVPELTEDIVIEATTTSMPSANAVVRLKDDDAGLFSISPIGASQIRNVAFPFTVAAQTLDGELLTSYARRPTIEVREGLTSLTASPTTIAGPSFFNGVASVSLTVSDFADGAVVVIADPITGGSGTSNTFAVGAGAPATVEWSPVPATVYSGTPFSASLTVRDVHGNPVKGLTGPVSVDGNSVAGWTGERSYLDSNLFFYDYPDQREQIVYLSEELPGPMEIRALTFETRTGGWETSPRIYSGLTVRIKHTDLSGFTGADFRWDNSGWTTVYSGSPVFSTGHLHSLVFQTPFAYNGAQNLMVDVSFNDSFLPPGTTYGVWAKASSFIPMPRAIASSTAESGGNPLNWEGTEGSAQANYQRIDFEFSGVVPVEVHPNPLPMVDGQWTGELTLTGEAAGITLSATAGGLTATTNIFDLLPPPDLQIQVASAVVEGDGPLTAAMELLQAPTSDLTVSLSADSPDVVLPATVLVLAGQTSANFAVQIVNDSIPENVETITLTATAPGLAPATAEITLEDDDPGSYEIAPIGLVQRVGEAFQVEVTAKLLSGSIAGRFAGMVDLSAVASGIPLAISPTASGSFVGGVWAGSVTGLEAATDAVLTATDSQGSTGSSNAFEMRAHGPLDHFEWQIGRGATVGMPMPVGLVAKDADGHTVQSFDGTAALAARQPVEELVETGSVDYYSTSGFQTNLLACRMQCIYRPEEVGGVRTIRRIGFWFSGSSAIALENFNLRLKHTSQPNYETGQPKIWEDSSGFTTAFSGVFDPTSSKAYDFVLDTPFEYNGTDNLMVDLSFYQTSTTSAPGNLSFTGTDELRRMFYASNANLGSPLSWSGSSPGPTLSSGLPVFRFLCDETATFNPNVTGSFTNGVWNGSLTFSLPHPATVLEASSGGKAGLSPPVAVTSMMSPVLSPEPMFTGGVVNSITGTPGGGAAAHEIVVSPDADFANVIQVLSGPVPAGMATGLSDGQVYHYRARGLSDTAAQPKVRTWAQVDRDDFTVNSFSGTSPNSLVGDVTLAVESTEDVVFQEDFEGSPSDWSGTIFSDFNSAYAPYLSIDALSTGPDWTPNLPVNQEGDLEGVLAPGGPSTKYARMPDTESNRFSDGEIEGYFGFESDTPTCYGGLILRSGSGSSASGYLARVAATSAGFQVLLLRMTSGASFSLGITHTIPGSGGGQNLRLKLMAEGPNIGIKAWTVFTDGSNIIEVPVTFPNGTDTISVVDYSWSEGRAGVYAFYTSTTTANKVFIDDVKVTKRAPTYVTSGSVSSVLIEPPYVSEWGTLEIDSTTGSATGALSVDVLDRNGQPLMLDVSHGTSLATLGAEKAIQLRANLSLADATAAPPVLRSWRVNYNTIPTGPVPGPWSNVVSSTQDASPPVIGMNPADEKYTAQAETEIGGAAADAVSGVASVRVDGAVASTSDGFANWTKLVSGLAPGSNTVTIEAADNAVPPNTASVTYHIFRIENATGQTNANGVPDLLNHALNLDAPGVGRDGLPAAVMDEDPEDGKTYLTLQYRRRIHRAGFRYIVETSSTLAPDGWDDTGASVEETGVTPNADGVTETVTVRITPAIGDADAKFVRLRVEVD